MTEIAPLTTKAVPAKPSRVRTNRNRTTDPQRLHLFLPVVEVRTRGRLQLNRGVINRDFVVMLQTILNLTQDFHGMPVVETLVFQDDMRSQNRQPRGHGGSMQIMHRHHVWQLQQYSA